MVTLLFTSDDDECTSSDSGCSHDCVNTPGGYHCTCPVGYTLDSSEKTCTGKSQFSSQLSIVNYYSN